MKLSQFIYELPKEAIAKYPAENRDDSKLMVLHRKNIETPLLALKSFTF